jgi:hypothetical protein
MAKELDETPDILKIIVGGIQPAQEIIVTITVLQVLEVECGAYQLRIPQCFFVKYDNSESVQQTLYSYKIAIFCQQKLDFLSIPKGSISKF